MEPTTHDEDGRFLSERVTGEAWQEIAPTIKGRARPDRPLLIQFAGVPLCGKSTMARALVEQAPTAVVHAENDALRERAAKIMGREPQYDPFENFVTYQAAWTLCRKGLQDGVHAVHDATNLRESGRRKAYRMAEEAGCEVFVVFVLTEEPVLHERAKRLSKTRQKAHEKHLGKKPVPEKCSKPHTVLDGARPVKQNLEVLRSQEELGGLWRTTPP